MPIEKKYFSIAPVNDNPVTVVDNDTFKTSQGYSHKQGNPIIRFSLPSSNVLLETSSLRLVGQYQVKTSNDNVVLVSKTHLDENNGANLARATSANMPNFGGVQNTIDKIVIQSKKSNVELSNSTNYSMNASLVEAYRNADQDYKYGSEANQSLSQGYNAVFSNRRYNLSANHRTKATHAGLELGSVNNKEIGQHFSLNLEVDMLKAGNLHLGQDYLNGLLITMHLNPDSAFFHQRFREVVTNQTLAGIDNVMYVLKNVRLEGRYLVPNPDDLANYQPIKLLNSKLNILNDVHSDDNSFQYTPQVSAVKSMYNLFLDNDQTNNKTLQQNNFKMPVGIKEIEQSKDNLRYPLDFPVKVTPNQESHPVSGITRLQTLQDVDNLFRKSDIVGDCEVRHHFTKSVTGRTDGKSVNNIRELHNSLTNDYASPSGDANNAAGSNMFPLMVGVGADYSYGLSNTLNFVNRDYSAQIKSGVGTGLPIYPAMSNNKSELVQTYVKHVSALDTQKLVKTM